MIFIIKNLNLNSIQSRTYQLQTRSSCYLQWVTHNSDGHLWGGWGGKEGEKARGEEGNDRGNGRESAIMGNKFIAYNLFFIDTAD